jgi:hypothetical protein
MGKLYLKVTYRQVLIPMANNLLRKYSRMTKINAQKLKLVKLIQK